MKIWNTKQWCHINNTCSANAYSDNELTWDNKHPIVDVVHIHRAIIDEGGTAYGDWQQQDQENPHTQG